jgi:hypothetical protein
MVRPVETPTHEQIQPSVIARGKVPIPLASSSPSKRRWPDRRRELDRRSKMLRPLGSLRCNLQGTLGWTNRNWLTEPWM